MAKIVPTDIALHQKSRVLELTWPDGVTHTLSCEFLRVYSPSAEVRGHGPGQEKLQIGKQGVNITGIEPVGHYAIKLIFDDGHDSGLYNWDLLRDFGDRYQEHWDDYLARCAADGYVREEAMSDSSSSVEIFKP